MALDQTPLHGDVVALLALDGAGGRRIPLVCAAPAHDEAARRLSRARPGDWFPGARSPHGALAGLWVYFSCFPQAHAVAQDLHTPEGSYWHGILHRQEPDDWNAAYWMKRAGTHPIHADLRRRAEESGVFWTPLSFIDFCARARREPGSETESLALDLQLAEWQLLFSWCASVRP